MKMDKCRLNSDNFQLISIKVFLLNSICYGLLMHALERVLEREEFLKRISENYFKFSEQNSLLRRGLARIVRAFEK